jgi:hypothetical protein
MSGEEVVTEFLGDGVDGVGLTQAETLLPS